MPLNHFSIDYQTAYILISVGNPAGYASTTCLFMSTTVLFFWTYRPLNGFLSCVPNSSESRRGYKRCTSLTPIMTAPSLFLLPISQVLAFG
ncbi:hypothetical protein BDV11DRAFT_49725 [Aspergillus similis]